MKQTGYVHLDVEKGDNIYTFSMPMGASLAEATDSAFMMFKTIDKMYREALDKELEKKEFEDKAAEVAELKKEEPFDYMKAAMKTKKTKN